MRPAAAPGPPPAPWGGSCSQQTVVLSHSMLHGSCCELWVGAHHERSICRMQTVMQQARWTSYPRQHPSQPTVYCIARESQVWFGNVSNAQTPTAAASSHMCSGGRCAHRLLRLLSTSD